MGSYSECSPEVKQSARIGERDNMGVTLFGLYLMSLLTLSPASPAPRDPDHYIDRREFWGRGRSLVQLPVSLVTRTSDYEDDVSANEIIPEEPAAEQATSNLVLLKSPDIKFDTNSSTSPEEESTPPPPSTRPESKLRPLDYYYQFISVNGVDGTSRGGDGDNLVTLTCRHEVRVQG